jgi:hypothetical protein
VGSNFDTPAHLHKKKIIIHFFAPSTLFCAAIFATLFMIVNLPVELAL